MAYRELGERVGRLAFGFAGLGARIIKDEA